MSVWCLPQLTSLPLCFGFNSSRTRSLSFSLSHPVSLVSLVTQLFASSYLFIFSISFPSHAHGLSFSLSRSHMLTHSLTHTHTHTHTQTNTHTHTCIHIQNHISMYICTSIYTYIYIQIHVYIYTCIYIYQGRCLS